MYTRNQGWTSFLRQEGADFLDWVKTEQILSNKLDVLATALSSLLRENIHTSEQALDVWKAVPAVLCRCNDQAAYELPGAAEAYAWLHLLDRYTRTWIALERLVENHCLPLGKYGVNALDVGTGPGPAAFAIHDFYSAMTSYSEARGTPKWQQPSHVTCVEFDRSTNHFRHILAEIMFEQAQRQSEGVLAMCHALSDFGKLQPTQERKQYLQTLRNSEDEYFDEVAGHWTSESHYLSQDANALAQSLHRYRLITFSNFLTTVNAVKCFESNLLDVLQDAAPGSVLLVLGGKRGPYPEVYEYMNRLAEPSGFKLKVSNESVSCKGSGVENRVYEEGSLIYQHLQGLSENNDVGTRKIRAYFERESRPSFPSSEIRVYRK